MAIITYNYEVGDTVFMVDVSNINAATIVIGTVHSVDIHVYPNVVDAVSYTVDTNEEMLTATDAMLYSDIDDALAYIRSELVDIP